MLHGWVDEAKDFLYKIIHRTSKKAIGSKIPEMFFDKYRVVHRRSRRQCDKICAKFCYFASLY